MYPISILMPVYNREKYLQKALDTALNQTYPDIEILIYNDGSIDNSFNIIQEYQQKHPNIILINNSQNNGVAFARNVLIHSCTTQYAMWLDSDDEIDSHKVALQVKLMQEKEQLIFTHWHWLNIEKNGWKARRTETQTSAFATLMFPVNKGIKFDVSRTIGGEDWDWIERMRKIYPETTLKQDLYSVRMHEDRIGNWKRVFKNCFTEQELKTYTYAQLIERYKQRG